MKRTLLSLSIMILFALGVSAQVFIDEDFSGAFPPEGWSRDGVPGQWSKSATNNAGGEAAEVKFTYINQNTTSRLITPVVDLTGYNSVAFSFRHFYEIYTNGPKIGAAYRVGTGDWQVLWEQTPTANVGPELKLFELNGAGQADMQLCIYITGNLYNVNYWYIDDVKLYIPLDLDASLRKVDLSPYVAGNTSFNVKGVVGNEGAQSLNSFTISYTINGGTPVAYNVTGLNIPMGGGYDFVHPDPITLTEIGSYTIVTSISNINGGNDQNPDNNSIEKVVSVVPFIPTKKVLAEEATGTWCPWCIRGTCFMSIMAETYPDTWIGVAVHNGDPMVYAPYDNSIGSIIPGFIGFPQCTSDRTANDTDPSELEAAYNRRINVISPATIDLVNFSWNPDSRKVEFDLRSEFIAPVSDLLRFGVIITEDSLWGTTSQWNQANAYAGGAYGPMCGYENMPGTVPASQMHYDHVARTILDSPFGTEGSLPNPIAANAVHSYSYSIDIPETWRYDKLHFIGFLLNNETGEILNANNVISHYVNINEQQKNEINFSMYPNPAKNEVSVVFDLKTNGTAELQLIDLMGKTVLTKVVNQTAEASQLVRFNTENLRNGTYILKLQSQGQSFVQKLVINK